MQIDISKDGRDNSALRRPTICLIVSPIFHIAGLEHHLNDVDYPFIIYLLFQYRYELVMVDIVKESFVSKTQ